MPYMPVPLDNTCVLYIRAEDNLATGYDDATHYGNNATVAGAVPCNGISGQGISFDGADDCLSIADAASLDCTTLTVAAWVRLAATWLAVGHVIGKCEDSGSEYSYGFGVDAAAKPFLLVSNDGAAGTAETANAAISLDAWHHIAGTFSGGTYLLYVDGAVVASDAVGADLTIYAGTGRVTVGARYDSGAAEAVEEFKDLMDDVIVFNRVLSAQEIHELYMVHAGDDTREA